MGGGEVGLDRLDRIQVRAIRIIGHTEGIKLQSLAHRRGVAALCVMHRLVKKRSPSPLHSLIPAEAKTRRPSAHQHRIQPAFAPPNVRKALYWQHSCIPLLTNMWNTLVKPEIRRIANQQEFKKPQNNETLQPRNFEAKKPIYQETRNPPDLQHTDCQTYLLQRGGVMMEEG